MRHSRARVVLLAIALMMAAKGLPAQAQSAGFNVGRYVPSTPGELSFWVSHPWYNSIRPFAVGLTLDYGHNPVMLVQQPAAGGTTELAVIERQLLAHLDIGFAIANRIQLSGSLPIVLLERGTAAGGVSPSDAGLADPNFGAMVRIFGEPYRDAVSLHAGVRVWVPIGEENRHASDGTVRLMPRAVLSGFAFDWLLWSTNAGFLWRENAGIGTPPANTNSAGPELHLGGAIAYAKPKEGFAVGPEVLLATTVTDGRAFERDQTSIEALMGIHKIFGRAIQVGLGAGAGFRRQVGTPDARLLFRIAYAPLADEPPPPAPPPPPPPPEAPKDTDGDGIIDAEDVCVDVHAGPHPDPDPARRGCPLLDRDRDTVFDKDDACPDEPGAPSKDPQKNGCPGLVEVKEGKVVILKPVFFATNKDIILQESFPVLKSVADALQASPQIKRLSIDGHTDNTGTRKWNQSLSERRAASVMKFLVGEGVDPGRLEAHGYGFDKPISTNATALGRSENRRVEFRIVEQTGEQPGGQPAEPPPGAAQPPGSNFDAGGKRPAKGNAP